MTLRERSRRSWARALAAAPVFPSYVLTFGPFSLPGGARVVGARLRFSVEARPR